MFHIDHENLQWHATGTFGTHYLICHAYKGINWFMLATLQVCCATEQDVTTNVQNARTHMFNSCSYIKHVYLDVHTYAG